MIQKKFAEKTTEILRNDESVIGLAVAGSWLTDELDEFSDLDLILVTTKNISGDKIKMLEYAGRFGKLLTGFTGEHVGEPRVLICLYDNPLLHVDLKFLTLTEFHLRIETPVILLDRNGQLANAIRQSEPKFPYPDYQWIEDRYWIWVHYALLKIGRGEYLEAFDFFSSLRNLALGPLLHMKNGNLPKGIRKVEWLLGEQDLGKLKSTVPSYNKGSLILALENSISLYRELRKSLYPDEIIFQNQTEKKVVEYLQQIKAGI